MIVVLASVAAFLAAAKSHGRQVKLERELAGYWEVRFGAALRRGTPRADRCCGLGRLALGLRAERPDLPPDLAAGEVSGTGVRPVHTVVRVHVRIRRVMANQPE